MLRLLSRALRARPATAHYRSLPGKPAPGPRRQPSLLRSCARLVSPRSWTLHPPSSMSSNNSNDVGAPGPCGGWSATPRSPVQREEPLFARPACNPIDKRVQNVYIVSLSITAMATEAWPFIDGLGVDLAPSDADRLWARSPSLSQEPFVTSHLFLA